MHSGVQLCGCLSLSHERSPLHPGERITFRLFLLQKMLQRAILPLPYSHIAKGTLGITSLTLAITRNFISAYTSFIFLRDTHSLRAVPTTEPLQRGGSGYFPNILTQELQAWHSDSRRLPHLPSAANNRWYIQSHTGRSLCGRLPSLGRSSVFAYHFVTRYSHSILPLFLSRRVNPNSCECYAPHSRYRFGVTSMMPIFCLTFWPVNLPKS